MRVCVFAGVRVYSCTYAPNFVRMSSDVPTGGGGGLG